MATILSIIALAISVINIAMIIYMTWYFGAAIHFIFHNMGVIHSHNIFLRASDHAEKEGDK